ncbi:MAG: hypothetical protein RLZZ543_2309 [Bacteroidota bacterium]|jgi:uncharacterized repeat protein (TIGR01451 family)
MIKRYAFVCAALFISLANTLQAQVIDPADQYKLDHPTIVPSTNNAERSGEPGSDCDVALPLTDGVFTYLATTNTFFSNIITNPNIYLINSCLATAPNQTWFAFSTLDTVNVNMTLSSTTDYDYIILDGTNTPCNQITSPDTDYVVPPIVSCSYTFAPVETITGVVYPGHTYYLVITNFANQPNPFTLEVSSGNNIIPINSALITGKVYADLNNNCMYDGEDSPITNAQVLYEGTILYDVTDANGDYSMLVPAGSTGTIAVSNGNLSPLLWQNSCAEQQAIFPIDFGGTSSMVGDVAFYSNLNCAIPSVSTSTPFMRRCFTNARQVQYCNQGTLPLENAVVTLTYEPGIYPVYASIPYTQNGNEYIFNVDTVSVGGCGSFYVIDSVGCENGIGSYALVEARISPIPTCITIPAEWDLSDLEVHALCSDSTTATFTVSNNGTGNMSMAMPYEIRRNDIVESNGTLQLNAGASQSFSVANNNDLVTLSIAETAGNPFNNIAWAFSDCNSALNFGGIAPSFAINDQQPWLDQDIELIIGAYDPNDKFAWPFGAGNTSKISRTDDLEYRIRFQNTGNDTAFTIVVVDTLSALLNPSTIRITGNSHPFIYDVQGNVVTFTFPNILLPDSTTNLEGSIGYIRFNIAQVVSNPDYYQIDNSADIYFDFNPPVRTNTAIRTVGLESLGLAATTSTSEKVIAYPVPASDVMSFTLPSSWNASSYTFQLSDLTGRMVQQRIGNGSTMTTSVNELHAGIYLAVFFSKEGRRLQVPIVVE